MQSFMKKAICLLLAVMMLPVFSGCASSGSGENVTVAFLNDLAKGDYKAAYAHLSSGVRNDTEETSSTRVTEQEFADRYTNIFDALEITGFDYEITGVQEGEIISLVDYHLIYHSTLAGDMEYDFTLTAVREDGKFFVEWSPALIFPIMTWGDKVWVTGLSATRGEIIAEQTGRIIREYPSISSLDECFLAAFRFALENKQAVRHIYHSVNRDIFTQGALQMCEHVVRTYIATVFPADRLCGRDKEIVIRFLKCQLFGMCIDWIERGMTDAAYDDLHRMLELLHDLPELIVRRSAETAQN